MLSRTAYACLVASFIGLLPGCKSESSGASIDKMGLSDYTSEGEASSYKTSSDGGVSAITSESFFVERKEIIPFGDGPEIFFVLDRNTIQACSPSVGCGAPLALNHTKDMPAVCRGTNINDALANEQPWYLVCSSIAPAPVEESTDGKYKSRETIAASVPWLLVEDFSRGRLFRARFKVRASGVEQPQRKVVDVSSKCELIERGEAEARQQCQSGNFNACREISGWIANKVMEGCSSVASSPTGQVREGNEGAASNDAQSQSSSSIDTSTHEGQVAEEATIDITSRNMNPPKYPPAAFRAGVQGVVGLVVDVDANGGVVNVTVERSSRNRDLDRAAIEAARRWGFNAAKSSSGKSVAGRIRVPVTFSLDRNESAEGDSPQDESTSSAAFGSIRDAIAELWAHSDYANLREVDFSRIDAARGVAELDASTQMFLPPGSTDTLVMYTENNAGTPFLTVERFDGRHWRDVSAATLPGYINRNGSNYFLDGSGGAIKVRSLPAKKAWRYNNGRFVQEG